MHAQLVITGSCAVCPFTNQQCLRSSHHLLDLEIASSTSVYVSNVFKSKVFHCTTSLPTIETLLIETVKENYKFLINISIYRPPSANAKLFVYKLSELLNIIFRNGNDKFILCVDFNLDNNGNTMNFLNSFIYNQTKQVRFRHSYLWCFWPSSIIYSKTKPVYKKILTTKHKCEISYNQWLNYNYYLRQSLLCLDLDHCTGSDNCTTAMESVAHAVDNTYKLCILLNLKYCQTKSSKSSELPVK